MDTYRRMDTNEVREAAIKGALNASGPVFALIYIGDRIDEMGAGRWNGVEGTVRIAEAISTGLADLSREIAARP